MYRVLSALLLPGMLFLMTAVAPQKAAAGDYYDGESYRSHYGTYTSSNCCYQRVVRYERVHNENYERPYYSDRYHAYYGRTYDTSRYSEPRRYYGGDYARNYVEGCSARSVRIADGRGGWVWGALETCY
jgi:hypothetical protein